MKECFFLIPGIIVFCTCSNSGTSINEFPVQKIAINNLAAPEDSIPPTTFLSITDAEMILGEPAHTKGNPMKTTGKGITTYQNAYEANATEKESEKKGAIYWLLEHYAADSSAHNKYSFIKKANESHKGIETLEGVGDEAYFHSDGENFYFIMVRKGPKVFNMKVNKITALTSLDKFNRIARRIAKTL